MSEEIRKSKEEHRYYHNDIYIGRISTTFDKDGKPVESSAYAETNTQEYTMNNGSFEECLEFMRHRARNICPVCIQPNSKGYRKYYARRESRKSYTCPNCGDKQYK